MPLGRELALLVSLCVPLPGAEEPGPSDDRQPNRPCAWYLKSEALGLRRRRVDERSFVFAVADNTRLLDTTQWTTPAELGARLTLGRQLDSRTAIELLGYWEGDFKDQAAINAPTGTVRQPFFNHLAYPPPIPQIGSAPALVELAYQSQIHNLELNLRRWHQGEDDHRLRWGFLLGPRYFSLREQFQDFDSQTLTRGATPNDSVYRTFVDNKLLGGQIGGLIELTPCPNLTLLSETKWGGFANQSDATNRLELQDGTHRFFEASTAETRFSGIVELGLEIRWQQSARLEFRAGYLAMYVWNMTSAPDVLSFNLLTHSKQNHELAFWVHGPTAGFLIRF